MKRDVTHELFIGPTSREIIHSIHLYKGVYARECVGNICQQKAPKSVVFPTLEGHNSGGKSVIPELFKLSVPFM